MSRRTEKMSELIRHKLAELLYMELVEVEVTISAVEIEPDLRFARVFLQSVVMDEPALAAKAEELNLRQKRLAAELFRRLGLKNPLELRFMPDQAPVQAARVEELIQNIHHSEERSDSPRSESPIGARESRDMSSPETNGILPGVRWTPDQDDEPKGNRL